MELQFLDRVLNCSDCQTDFIFTAGEQLFFHEKQFKNDPKRCKNCKARRAGLSGAAPGAGGATPLSARPETRTSCSDCGVETTVPFKPTQGRPVLCRQCYQKKLRPAIAPPPGIAAANGTPGEGLHEMLPQHAELPPAMNMPMQPQGVTAADAVAALAALPVDRQGSTISPEAALMAAASIICAHPHSSVATLEEIESMSAKPHAQDKVTSIPYELLHDLPEEHAELLAANVEIAEA